MKSVEFTTNDGKTAEIEVVGNDVSVRIDGIRVNTDNISHVRPEDMDVRDEGLIGLFLGDQIATSLSFKPHVATRFATEIRRHL